LLFALVALGSLACCCRCRPPSLQNASVARTTFTELGADEEKMRKDVFSCLWELKMQK
jgi:hypothetical protein